MRGDKVRPELPASKQWWSTLALAPVLLALALWALPRAVQGGDAGEFTTVMLAGGVPHPSGYPWMRALGLLARALWGLGVPPAMAAAIPPALAGVAAWLLIHRCALRIAAARGLDEGGWIAAFVVLLAGASPLALLHVADAEVWGPHLLFSALFVHAVIRLQSRPRPLRLGLWLGLAVSHHLTAVLLIPLAVGAALPRFEGREPKAAALELGKNGGLGLAGSALGLLPWLTLPIGAGGAWRWGDVRTLDGLVHHLLRRDYGTFSLSLHEEQVSALDTVARALASLGEVASAGLVSAPWFGALLALAIVIAAGLALRGAPVQSLRPAVALGWATSLGAAALAFPAMQNIDPHSPFGAWILERFDLLPLLLAVVPASLGLAWLGDRLTAWLAARSQSPRIPTLLKLGGGALATLLLFAQLGAVLERGLPSGERGVERAAVDLVASPDPGPDPESQAIPSPTGPPVRAIVFGTDDHRSFPVLYAQEILGAGEHTLYIDAQLLAHPWYRARLRERLPTLPDVDKPLRLIGAIWADPELAAVPIYLANVFSAPAQSLPRVPEGLLWRVPLPADHPDFDATRWTAQAIVERHLAALARCRIEAEDFSGIEHPRGHPWSAELWHAYVDKSRVLAAKIAGSDARDRLPELEAALAERTGASLAP